MSSESLKQINDFLAMANFCPEEDTIFVSKRRVNNQTI